jgi:hypothetical protein
MSDICISIEVYEEYRDMDIGMCVKCGAEKECCEPDARKYKCDDCGLRSVYGSEELLIMGFVQ